jgi:hypothetical protein
MDVPFGSLFGTMTVFQSLRVPRTLSDRLKRQSPVSRTSKAATGLFLVFVVLVAVLVSF